MDLQGVVLQSMQSGGRGLMDMLSGKWGPFYVHPEKSVMKHGC